MNETVQARAETTTDTGEALLELIRRLVLELHPRRGRRMRVTLDSNLDRDLGFDSLSRVELLLSLQRRFGVALPEKLFAEAETPRDLLRALRTAGVSGRGARPPSSRAVRASGLAALDSVPESCETLGAMLAWHVERNAERQHVYLYGDAPDPEALTYLRLMDSARALAAGLQARGVRKGQSVSIMLPTGTDYLFSFFGVLLAGAVPVPIYPPLRPSQIEDHLRRHAGILANAETSMLITSAEALRVARLMRAHVPGLEIVVTAEELRATDHVLAEPHINADDVAFLQYTSGSTGQPKGVVLTHANVLANIRAMGEAVGAVSTDVFVSWLPLYHDMGLIGAWLASLYFGIPLVLMSPLKFLTYPPRWLHAIHDHRATLTAAPNFAYELCLSKIEPHEIEGLDLSSLRATFNGAEPVSPNTVRRFTERFARYGFRPEAFAPVYGLAEATVGVAFPPLGRGPIIDRVQRRPFESTGNAIAAAAGDEKCLEFVSCGQPLPGYQIRIVDNTGRELPDRQEGRLEFQGPSTTSGYKNNPEASAGLFDGAWLDSGDLAYIAGGDVFLTRRIKDVIIRGGRNVYPYELEEAVGDISGVRKGCVAVFGSPDPVSGTERVVIVAETRERDPVKLDRLRHTVTEVATDVLEMPPDEVVLAPPHSVLKTSSGKIRRSAVRDLFETDRLGQQTRAVWWQVASLVMSGWLARIRRSWRLARTFVYAGYFWAMVSIIAVPAWLLVTTAPGAGIRLAIARGAGRLVLRLLGLPLTVSGTERIPRDRAAVFIANHASYIDGLVLLAVLPVRFVYVAKRELGEKRIAGPFLRGIGTAFTERVDTERSVADTRKIAALAKSGTPVLFFPEGTFTRAPGILPFRMGAFVTATEAHCPVVPITLVGTRSVLRDGSWFPRRGAVQVIVEQPLQAQGEDWSASVKLRDAAREAVLAHSDEPDVGET